MSAVNFLSILPSVEYSSAKQTSHREKAGLEDAKSRHSDHDKFKPSINDKRDKNIDDPCSSTGCDSRDSSLYVQDAQGEYIEIPINVKQLQHLTNLDRVSLADPEVLENFGGLNEFVDALKSLLPGSPEMSGDDLVSLPYQIEAISDENFGSETFPHLIAANLSPAELNVLAKQLDGLHAGTTLAQIKQQDMDKPISVVFISGADQSASNQDMSAAEMLISTENIGFGKWFQQADATENSVSLREVISEQIENVNAEAGVFSIATGKNSGGKQNAVFENMIADHFAKNNGDNSIAKGTLFGQSFAKNLEGSLVSPLLDAGIDLNEHLHTVSTTPTTNSSLQSLHAHGALGSQKAGQAHQATQLVATNIQKAAENGGNQKLSVLLNPPELGRVQIDVEMDSSNKLKVTMVTEQESAYMLLKRDSHALEQTLQNSGLDIDSSDIELSFSGSEFSFGHEDRQKYSDFGLPANNSGDEQNLDADIIDTQIDVFKDPYTGMWHCNIVV